MIMVGRLVDSMQASASSQQDEPVADTETVVVAGTVSDYDEPAVRFHPCSGRARPRT